MLLQKIEMGHGVLGVTRKPSFVQGPRKSISGGQISRNSRDHETLFFSEYGEGSSYNKYLEIYNGTGSDADMSGYAIGVVNNDHNCYGDDATEWNADGTQCSESNPPNPWYEINTTSTGGSTTQLWPLVGTLADGDVYVVTRSNADADNIVPEGDYIDAGGAGSPASFNGDDWLGLYKLNSDGTE